MPQEQESPKDLEDFVQQHDKLLTAIGVFAGLTALFTTIETKDMGNLLAFWSFAIFSVLSWELFTKFPQIKSFNNRLVLFQMLTMFLGFCIFLYLIIVYTAYSLVFGSLFAVLFGSAIIAVYVKFAERHKTSGKVIGFFAEIAFIIGIGMAMLVVVTIIVLILSLVLPLFGIQVPWNTHPTS